MLGINGQRALRIQEGRIRQTGRAAEFHQQRVGTRILERFVGGVFLNHELHRDKIFFEDWLDIRPFQEGFEPPAPNTPGSAEVDEDGFVLRGRLDLSCCQQLIGRWRLGVSGSREEGEYRKKAYCGLHAPILPRKATWSRAAATRSHGCVQKF